MDWEHRFAFWDRYPFRFANWLSIFCFLFLWSRRFLHVYTIGFDPIFYGFLHRTASNIMPLFSSFAWLSKLARLC